MPRGMKLRTIGEGETGLGPSPKMFDESGDMRFGLNKNHPTDPEAEVQVMQPISPTYILGAVVYRPEMVEPVQEVLSELFEAAPLVVVDEF